MTLTVCGRGYSTITDCGVAILNLAYVKKRQMLKVTLRWRGRVQAKVDVPLRVMSSHQLSQHDMLIFTILLIVCQITSSTYCLEDSDAFGRPYPILVASVSTGDRRYTQVV